MVDVITFRCDSYDEEGNREGYTEHSFNTESYLPDMLSNFHYFLQGMGFTYVKDVYAVKRDGQEVGGE